MTQAPGAGTRGTAAAEVAYWRPYPPASRPYVVAKDMMIRWDGSEIWVKRGTLVHTVHGSLLWHAYGGEEGLHPAHGAQARP